ncbi:LacI family DNA-binding transcriptional regulator [Paracoccus laeviglucosivorans]|uniref:Transcriptional regulator, LacI family n=1 Tax=Paracoccus laeviglucosivorans TaxID=1197861 RepID=A0A521FN03_9RHOB|nr:LacI family DNA-binding transcriptional regulator [Paracoccus laeviglucosivorans]SMO97519.1 transcriptional regulator, LacI family [Paracoccus laeviglucosivorans]
MDETTAHATLEDVAAFAGVSTATVSRCINSPDRVAPATREKITNAIRALNYSPNFGAKALASRRTGIIGAVIPTLENAVFAHGIDAFERALPQGKYSLLVASCGYDLNREKQQIESLVARGADGLLLVGFDRDPSLYAWLAHRRVPFVLAWASGDSHHFAGFDNKAGMAAMIRLVLDLGHRKIAMISGLTDGNDRARARLEGVRQSLADRGLGLCGVAEVPYGLDGGGQAFTELMVDRSITAIVCGNDVLAAGALRAAHHMGLVVPRDITITGFDDIDIASITLPELTTVRVPHARMGQEAALMLQRLIEGQESESVLLPTEIVERGTHAPPGGR